MGIPLTAQSLGVPMPHAIESNQRYKTLDQFMCDHPGAVKNMVVHSKGTAVIDVYKKNNPDFGAKARIYSAPYVDLMGLERLKDVQNEYQGAIDRKREMQTDWNPVEEFLEDTVTHIIANRLGLDGVFGMGAGAKKASSTRRFFLRAIVSKGGHAL
jgi:hypothetical protein